MHLRYELDAVENMEVLLVQFFTLLCLPKGYPGYGGVWSLQVFHAPSERKRMQIHN